MKQIKWSYYSLMLIIGLGIFVASIYSAFYFILKTSKESFVNQSYDSFSLMQAQKQLDLLAFRLDLASVDPSTVDRGDDELHLLEQLGLAWARINNLSEGENAERLRQDEDLMKFKMRLEQVFERLELTLDPDLKSPQYTENPDYKVWHKQIAEFSRQFTNFTTQKNILYTIRRDLQKSQEILYAYFSSIALSGLLVLFMYGFALRRTIKVSHRLAEVNKELEAESHRLREAQDALAYQASHDALTRLINRYEFESRLRVLLDSAKQHQEQHALLYLDLDQFKVVNDTCGHAAGDELLRQLSALLKDEVREQDTLCRLGGDEFAALVTHANDAEAGHIAEAIREAVQNFRFMWERQLFDIGVSIGVVRIDQYSGTLAAVLSDADAACYLAKEKGRNRVHFYASDDQVMLKHKDEMAWVSRITQAFEEQRFRLFHQLIVPVDPKHHEKKHYEVLVRMLDEQDQIVPPTLFIPAAERYNLMPHLDRWIVQSLFEHLTSHPDELENLAMCSINLSGVSISDPTFPEFLIEQLERFKIPPEKVCFEVTETAAIANLMAASEFICRFRAIGCRFSLDDFGSGMSSFGYLKNLPVDFLKIDGSFVKDLLTDNVDRAMVEAIHRVGHVMNLKTIAEYVENEDILAQLQLIGVDYAQGFGIAKPRPLIA